MAGYVLPCYSLQLSHPLLPLPAMSTSLFSVSVSPLLSCKYIHQYHISRFHVVAVVVQSLSHVWLFTTPWTEALQVSLSLTISQSLPKFMSIESVMPSNHLIFCQHLLLLPSIFLLPSPTSSVSSSSAAFNLFSHQGLFQWVGHSHQAKVLA